jgi:glycogen synthase
MRVLMTADAVGGVWTYAVELARGLSANHVDVTVACLGPSPDPAQRGMLHDRRDSAGHAGPRRRPIELLEYPTRLEWMDEPWQDVDDAGQWLLQLAADMRADVVHLNGFAHGSLPWRCPVLVAGHSCVLSWWEAVQGTVAPRSWDVYAERVRRGLQAATLVVAPTDVMLASLQRHYGPLANARVIPNGRSRSDVRPAAKETFVLAAGRIWDQGKNVAALCAVAGNLTWPVYVAGETRAADNSSAEFTSHLLGRLGADDLAGWMARASIFALPVRYEPFGLSALEAAHAGCALVLGDIAAQREVWQDAATFVPPDDPLALTRALQRLIDDGTLRAELAARARARAAQFTARRMTEAYLDAYRALLPLAAV